MLVEWLANWTELLADASKTERRSVVLRGTLVPPRGGRLGGLCGCERLARPRGRLYNLPRRNGLTGLSQLPRWTQATFMHHILTWENQHPAHKAGAYYGQGRAGCAGLSEWPVQPALQGGHKAGGWGVSGECVPLRPNFPSLPTSHGMIVRIRTTALSEAA